MKQPGPNTRLRREREQRGWSQAEVARRVDTQPRNVSRWELGKSTPFPHYREKLCELFGKSAVELGFVEGESPTPPPDPPPAPLSDPRIPPLPHDGRELVGRQALLNLLLEQLCSSKNVALSGLPGVGKTALAVALAHHPRIFDTFRDGILWVGLGPRPNLSEQLSRWGTLMGLPPSETTQEENSLSTHSVALHDAIGMRRMLLVIDDAWDIDAALPFKVGGPNCALLVTTRFPAIAVRLASDNTHVLHELPTNDGLALLAQLAPRAVAYNRQAAKTLVQAVGGLPLALTLMGKYLQTQSHSDQPRRIRDALENLLQNVLDISESPAPVEHPTGLEPGTPLSLGAVIAVSYQQLDESARALLCSLSVFPPKPNSFSEDAALAVSQASLAALDQLSDAGLLESSGPGRYTLHQTIARYAAAHLTETLPGERLVAYAVTFLDQHATNYAALEMETLNILTGLKYAYEAGQHARFVQGVIAFSPFLRVRGLYDQAKLHLQRALQLVIWSGDTQTALTILLHLGYVEYKQEEYNQAEAHLREALALAQKHADDESAREALSYLAQVARARGDID